MAIQTIGLPKNYGQGLGEGIESLLTNLVSNKVSQLNQQRQAQSLQSILGSISPDKANALAQLPEPLQQLVLKDLLAQPSQEAYAQALGLGDYQNQLQREPQPKISGLESLELLQGKIPSQLLQQNQQQQFQQPEIKPQGLPRLNERQATELAKIRREEQKEQRKLSHEQQKEASKETLPFYNELTKGSKAAKDSNLRLNRMEKLVDSGKLQSNGFINLLGALGKLPVVGKAFDALESAFLNPNSQEFKKLSADFVKDAKNFFGSRITQQEVELFLNTVPTLAQSNAGKKRIINNMRMFNEAALLRKDAADKIIANNGGVRPRNLDSLIENSISKELDNLASRFTQGLNIEEEPFPSVGYAYKEASKRKEAKKKSS